MKYSNVTIRGNKESKKVKISSSLKPKIIENIEDKWQSTLDVVARIVGVPSGLIMRLNEETIEVYLSSNTEGNPYKRGEKEELIYGLYCETVIGTQEKLLIPNALKSKVWKEKNPDVGINMISYLGFPINWPDGEVFGTVCLLDNKENHFNNDYEKLLKQIKFHIEDDLNLLLLNNDLEAKNNQLEQLNKTKTRFLSLISHDIRGNIGSLSTFLNLLSTDFQKFEVEHLKDSLSSLSQLASTSYQTLENLLGWSKNDFIELKPEIKPVNVVDLIEETIEFFKYGILLKELQIKKQYYSDKAIVNTDVNMITVVLRNIISNAIKYSDRNGELSILVNHSNGKHTITIKDTGAGMSEDTIKKLFAYDKDHRDGALGESSAGIGLMLVKEFTDKLGADIIVESEPCEGTAFHITL